METHSLVGKEIGSYRIIAEINSGTFGSVYKAEHLYLHNRIVAIKFLHVHVGSPKERELFMQEAQFLATLKHRHILPLIDFNFFDGQPYMVADYAVGGSLRDLLRRQALLPIENAHTILTQVGEALQYAHTHNIIHRDLKPENILFDAQGEVLLADFGIATVLSTASVKQSAVMGTPPYMAPEQFRGLICKESDQYALGCIAYELLTGRHPFIAPDLFSMGFKHLSEQPVPPSQLNAQIMPAMEVAILKALGKQRAERHASVEAFVRALWESFVHAVAIVPTSPSPEVVSTPIISVLPTQAPTFLPPNEPQLGPEDARVCLKRANRLFAALINNDEKETLVAYDEVVSFDDQETLQSISPETQQRIAKLQQCKSAIKNFSEALGIRYATKIAEAYQLLQNDTESFNLSPAEQEIVAFCQAFIEAWKSNDPYRLGKFMQLSASRRVSFTPEEQQKMNVAAELVKQWEDEMQNTVILLFHKYKLRLRSFINFVIINDIYRRYLQTQISSTLPYKQTEKLQMLDKLRHEQTSDDFLWHLLEKEIDYFLALKEFQTLAQSDSTLEKRIQDEIRPLVCNLYNFERHYPDDQYRRYDLGTQELTLFARTILVPKHFAFCLGSSKPPIKLLRKKVTLEQWLKTRKAEEKENIFFGEKEENVFSYARAEDPAVRGKIYKWLKDCITKYTHTVPN